MENPKIVREMMTMMLGDDDNTENDTTLLSLNMLKSYFFLYIYNLKQANEAKFLPRLPSEW
jgi:hypothetical protein